MTTSAYFAKADLEDRLSAAVVRKLFDDTNVGAASASPLARLISDASSKVDSYLRPIYTLPLTAPYPNEVVRLALDVAVAYAAQRHPEVVRKDWQTLMSQAESDLEKLRSGKTRLDVVSTPEPAANTGGEFIHDNADLQAASPGESLRIWDDMGDYSR